MSNKAKEIDMCLRVIFKEKVGWTDGREVGEAGRGESGQYALCACEKLSENKFQLRERDRETQRHRERMWIHGIGSRHSNSKPKL